MLERAGIAIERDLIAEADPWIQVNGASAMRELLERGAEFDAVYAFNDSLALGAMRALDDAGLRVPGDVAVIGIDNTDEAAYSIPSLSTVDLGRQRIAETAVAALTDQMNSSERPAPQRVLVTSHSRRGSPRRGRYGLRTVTNGVKDALRGWSPRLRVPNPQSPQQDVKTGRGLPVEARGHEMTAAKLANCREHSDYGRSVCRTDLRWNGRQTGQLTLQRRNSNVSALRFHAS